MAEDNEKSRVKCRYVTDYMIYSVCVIMFWFVLCLNIVKPTVGKLHNVAIMPITVTDGLINYVGSVTDYYDSLLRLTNSNTDKTILSLVLLFIFINLMLYLFILVACKGDNEGCVPKYVRSNLKRVFIYNLFITSILLVVLLNASSMLIKLNKSELSLAITTEFQERPIAKAELEKRIGITTDLDGSKSFEVSKDSFNKSLKTSNYDYTVEDIKPTGKLNVLNVLNDIYYKVYEDDYYLGYSTKKN